MSEQEQNLRKPVDLETELEQTGPTGGDEKFPIIQKIEELKYNNEAKRPDDFPMEEYPLKDFPQIELLPIEDDFDFDRRGFMPSFGEPERYYRWPKIGFELKKLKLMPEVQDRTYQVFSDSQLAAFLKDIADFKDFGLRSDEEIQEHSEIDYDDE